LGQPAAKQGDRIVSVDMHLVIVPTPSGPVQTLLPHPFNGVIDAGLSNDLFIQGLPAATVGSCASNIPPHFPTPPGTSFAKPPTNRATIVTGSSTVFIDGKPAARNGDTATTCNDPADLPTGKVVAAGTVFFG